ncbi:hypothetical protein BC936DRAFT_148000 [Jimgerdemannia flammicorona]|uniref:Uncharacterized protein n=1 Tax=Jimgerdemannia flammicorona TaxID=994334 RepID=A0A433D405_9FUNG|nr:hypothetical protein BC936DRAFT_148000 [Jimgerdemannia flammicorona]
MSLSPGTATRTWLNLRVAQRLFARELYIHSSTRTMERGNAETRERGITI